MTILKFKTDLDAAFALAYSSLKASKTLFKRRHLRFMEEHGKSLDRLLHTANRMQLMSSQPNHDPTALLKCRRHLFIVCCQWISKQEEMHANLKKAWKGLWDV